MNIAAFDLSLTATGFATNFPMFNGLRSGVITPGALRGVQRLRYIRETVLELSARADLVVLEGLAFGAKGNAMLDLAGLAAVVRLALADSDRPYVDIPPASLKLFATGKGNAKKDVVFAAAIRKLEYQGNDHNEADALWLLEMATRFYVDDLRVQTQHEGRALENVKWVPLPELAHAAD